MLTIINYKTPSGRFQSFSFAADVKAAIRKLKSDRRRRIAEILGPIAEYYGV